ncbi:MAG TPA: sulfatase-like hydrolase/transferase [Terriglobales bacterium]|nr:sulfatase-like hydrolase/transferase [Terriglobales bacterium]
MSLCLRGLSRVLRHSLCRSLLVVGLAVSALAASPTPPNIILITLDTFRADRMDFLGSRRALTPNLDAFAEQSVVFTHAYAQVPLTAPSHASILTGTYPQFHQVKDFQTPLAQALPYTPEILRSHGYSTAAFIGSMVLDPGVGLAVGFDRGFDTYDAGFHQAQPGEDRYSSTERRGSEVVAHALAWLKDHPRGPSFIWLHLYDAHDPYDPPEPYKTKYASAPYDGEIAYVDAQVGKFLGELRSRGLYDSAIIAVMADHGEALGDHGEDFHGFFLYDETIRVPLLIKLPATPAPLDAAVKRAPLKQIDIHVGLVDVLPTILQAAGLAVPKEVQGESLLTIMTATPTPQSSASAAAPHETPDRPIYAESEYGHRAYGWSSLRALRTSKYLYIEAPRRELYDQTADPGATHNLSSTSAAVTSTLAANLDSFLQKTSSTRELPKLLVDPEAQDKLAALGYVATNTNPQPGARDRYQGADPKDKIETANLIHRANFLAEEGNFDDAIPLLQQLIIKEPAMALLYTKLGLCLVQMGEFDKAVPILSKLVELSPNSVEAHFQLAMALFRTEDFQNAVPQLEIVVTNRPRWERGYLLLATSYVRINRMPEAIEECKKVLAFSPEHYGANLFLGRVLVLSGDAAGALPVLKKAATLQPGAREPHLFLKDAYTQLGQNVEAAREQAEVERLSSGGPE